MSRARDVADKNLAVISAGNSGQILTSDGNNWSAQNAPITELADDTSPALGGDRGPLQTCGRWSGKPTAGTRADCRCCIWMHSDDEQLGSGMDVLPILHD